MQPDLTKIQAAIDAGYISAQKHPALDLTIYNYTQKCQFDRAWTEETLSCRGLILASDGSVVARPFRKFFNLDEAVGQGVQLPAADFVVTEKMDGSLGIMYWDNGTPCLATRGSFSSDQAIRGTRMLRSTYAGVVFDPDYSHLFEIVYPQNRVVVDYAGREDLILLAAIHTRSGREMADDELRSRYGGQLPIVQRYDGITDYTTLAASEQTNREGYVIAFPDGQRFKVKFSEYVRLHRLVTGVNARAIWELLRDGQPYDQLLDRVPDEFYRWVQRTIDELTMAYGALDRQALDEYERVRSLPSRKEQALAIAASPLRGVIFRMLDRQPYEAIIWKKIKPSAERPFTQEI